MKKLIIILIILTTAASSFAQKQRDELSFKDSQNPLVFQKIKNNTRIMKYTAADGSIISVGDTLVIGVPSGKITTTVGRNIVGGAESRTKSNFQTIILGRPVGFTSILSAMNGEEPLNAGSNMQGEKVIVSEMKVIHKGSRKKPLALEVLLGEPNGRAFGANKYLSVTDYEKSVLDGEIKSLHAPLTRAEAIAKLKESKELLDLGIIKADKYEKLKKELIPIIIKK